MNEPIRCDVLIVGGGPAGSVCAWQLRNAGFDTVVLDKKSFPRDKVCAGWVTPLVLDVLDIDSGDYSQSRVLQGITGFRTGLIGRRAVTTRYDHIVSYGIRRCEFDQYLLQRSRARVLAGEPLQSLKRTGNGWLANGNISASLLIGAGGHFCPVARYLGADVGSSECVVAAQEVEFLMNSTQRTGCRVEPERPELYFCTDLKGYGWVFRKGDYLNIGLGREDTHKLSGQTDAFLEWLKRQGRVPADTPSRFKGHAYLLYSHGQRRLVDDGVLLIGDAAGLAYPQSGEGIRPAIESGLLAARTVIEAGGDYSSARLEAYRSRLIGRFGDRKPGNASVLPAGVRNVIGGWLLGSRWFTRHVVLDQWFLHAHQPALKAAS
ncbi:NAD(P)/FAD-dependent oxidoreductase [Thiogranum longum]